MEHQVVLMNVTLKPELAKFLEEQVRLGHYASAEEALNAAVARLQADDDLTDSELAQIRGAVDLGIAEADRGEFVEFTAEAVIKEQRAARAAKGK